MSQRNLAHDFFYRKYAVIISDCRKVGNPQLQFGNPSFKLEKHRFKLEIHHSKLEIYQFKWEIHLLKLEIGFIKLEMHFSDLERLNFSSKWLFSSLISQTEKFLYRIEHARFINRFALLGFGFEFVQSLAAFLDYLAQTLGEFGIFFENRFQASVVNFQNFGFLFRQHGRRARLAGEQSHLAEKIAFA